MQSILVVLIMLCGLVWGSVANAAYLDQAEILRYEQDRNGAARLVLRFTGNAGEDVVDRAYHIAPDSTFAKLRNWVSDVVTELNLARTAGTAPQVAPGAIITALAPTPFVTPAKSIWRDKVEAYRTFCGNGFVGSVATTCATLKSNIESTYQARYLDAN